MPHPSTAIAGGSGSRLWLARKWSTTARPLPLLRKLVGSPLVAPGTLPLQMRAVLPCARG